jgi:hypothetical protein
MVAVDGREITVVGSNLSLIQVRAKGGAAKAEALAACLRVVRDRAAGRKVARERVVSENLFLPDVTYECWVENDNADPATIVEGAKC